ncbi:hypothetical protein [Streptomyces brasiliensis]|uniref:hypothetical protein n=1 Tax=Streptomyces brasiliensis TaxID=1954 RepID=UPI0016703705|nr:hypothetical protein [Streptomyces brasiliensis]
MTEHAAVSSARLGRVYDLRQAGEHGQSTGRADDRPRQPCRHPLARAVAVVGKFRQRGGRQATEQVEPLAPRPHRDLDPDAVHLATARVLRTDSTALVTYDDRPALAAKNAGIEAVSPR